MCITNSAFNFPKEPHHFMNNIVKQIPTFISKETKEKIIKKMYKEKIEKDDVNNDYKYVWIIRPRLSYEYFSVKDNIDHRSIVAFQNSYMAKVLGKLIQINLREKEKDKNDKSIPDIDDIMKQIVIEKVELSFLHKICDDTSLNLIVFYSKHDKEQNIFTLFTQKFLYMKERDIKEYIFLLEEKIRIS